MKDREISFKLDGEKNTILVNVPSKFQFSDDDELLEYICYSIYETAEFTTPNIKDNSGIVIRALEDIDSNVNFVLFDHAENETIKTSNEENKEKAIKDFRDFILSLDIKDMKYRDFEFFDLISGEKEQINIEEKFFVNFG